MNFGTWEYANEMAKNGHTVYQYVFEYVNPKGFGMLGYLAPMISMFCYFIISIFRCYAWVRNALFVSKRNYFQIYTK